MLTTVNFSGELFVLMESGVIGIHHGKPLIFVVQNVIGMNLKLKDHFFIVTGAGSGFGRAIATQLMSEGAFVLGVARTKSVMEAFAAQYPAQLEFVAGDISKPEVQELVLKQCAGRQIDGVVVNAAGPPAKAFADTALSEWDEAYRMLLRWKVEFTQKLLPTLLQQGYGRLVYIESVSVKQPVENLVLSNALRPAVVGFVKSMAGDLARNNITANVLAPGYHNTAAMQRLFDRKALNEGITADEARQRFEQQIPVGRMGEADEMAVLACWLLSPLSRFVTGQTISHDGGLVKGFWG